MKKWLMALICLAALIGGTVAVTHYLKSNSTVVASGDSDGGGGGGKP